MNAFVTCALLLLSAGDKKGGYRPSAGEIERSGKHCEAERYCEDACRNRVWCGRAGSSDHRTVCRACFRD
jgi:hypothetical protein